jgi:predicted O-methyltransferase YrrM
VRARFADLPNVRVIQGRVPEVLAKDCPQAIAFLHVDLNNAAAEIAALELLYDRISPGGVILFDDFCWAASIRQQVEELAWFEARGEQVLALPTGHGLHIKR